MKLTLLTIAWLAATASANSGDWVTLNMNSGSSAIDQVRILTKPRAGYNPATDKVKVYQKSGNCIDDDALLEGHDVPVKYYECCKKHNLKGFKVWAEQQNVEIKDSDELYVDFLYDDRESSSKPNNGLGEVVRLSSGVRGNRVGGRKLQRDNRNNRVGNGNGIGNGGNDSYDGGTTCGAVKEHSDFPTVMGAGTFNSYMVQTYSTGGIELFDRVLQFPNQDIVALLYTNGAYRDGSKWIQWSKGKYLPKVLKESDSKFALDEWSYFYVEDYESRGTEVNEWVYSGWRWTYVGGWFKVNCEVDFSDVGSASCPKLSSSATGTVSSPIVEVEENEDSCAARGWGDPHMVTFDGFKYDVHVKGEITFLKSLDSSLEIQARTEAVENHAGKPAVTTGIVVHENDDLPTIQVSLAQDADTSENVEVLGNCPIQLFVDGVSMPLSGGTQSSSASVHTEGKKIYIQYSTQLKVVMKVEIWMQTCHFSVDYILGDCRKDERIIGVLGTPNKNWRDDWMDRGGNKIDYPVPMGSGTHFEPAYNYVRDNWCIIKDSDSYFTYEPGTDFDTFDKCDNP
eukprot:scaffold7427_cov162-Cylindrotheca_fusiformis.AAC.3